MTDFRVVRRGPGRLAGSARLHLCAKHRAFMEQPTPTVLVFITAPSTEVAEQLAHTVVEGRVAACVNIVPGVRSIYRWEGKTCVDAEALLIVKTTSATVPALLAAVQQNHPYDTPEFVVVNADSVSDRYAAWVRAAVEHPTKG